MPLTPRITLPFLQPKPRPPEPSAPAEDAAFAHNRAWELDRACLLQRSERRAWWVGSAGLLVGVLGVLAVLAQGPLRQVVGVPIVVDKTTGETTIQQRLSDETVPPQEALDKHNLAVFVRAREGYSWWWLQRDFEQVARMAVPAVFADYNRQFEGDAAIQKKLASTEEWRINVVSVRLSPTGRRGNRGDGTVTFDKITRLTERNLPDVVTRHVASVVYEYQPKVFAKEPDRLDNPFGFVVTAYRSDPEINTPGTVLSSAAGVKATH
jgi:type IV secretion system protein VirB8